MCGLVWASEFQLLFVYTRKYSFKKFYFYRKFDIEDENALTFILIDNLQHSLQLTVSLTKYFSAHEPRCTIDFF